MTIVCSSSMRSDADWFHDLHELANEPPVEENGAAEDSVDSWNP